MLLAAQDESNWDYLLLYAKLALERGMVEDAIRVSLRLLVQKSDAAVKSLLAQCLMLPGGLQLLLAELGSGGGSAAALAFLANTVKDQGAVAAAVELFAKAVALEPQSGSYALNYVHALELDQQYDNVVREVIGFCGRCTLQLAGQLRSLQGVVNELKCLPVLGSMTSLAWLRAEQWEPQLSGTSKQQQLPQAGTGDMHGPLDEGSGSQQRMPQGGTSDVHGPWDEGSGSRQQQVQAGSASAELSGAEGCHGGSFDREQHQPYSSTPVGGGHGNSAASSNAGSSSSSRSNQGPPVVKVAYTPPQLDLLALLFTAVKVAYVGGALALVYRLCDLIETARAASAVELHTTLIRNEAAYFGCILQLVRDHPPPPPPQEQLQRPPLYVCGDSHCLSAAWRTVQLRGHERLLQPLLVTGCKIWHLRPDSSFYPKVQFLNTMRKLPPGTQIIMLFGEIDCREGLLLAVEKCKYEDLEEGINHTVTIYIDVLLELIKERNFELFVHPIAPVLKETRPIVLPFMKALKKLVCAAVSSPAARGRLHYLDFFDQLLTLPGDAPRVLRPELELDGTHMAPAYVEHLNAALSSIP